MWLLRDAVRCSQMYACVIYEGALNLLWYENQGSSHSKIPDFTYNTRSPCHKKYLHNHILSSMLAHP